MIALRRYQFVSRTSVLGLLVGVVGASGCVRLPHFTPQGVLQNATQASSLCESLQSSAIAHQTFRALLSTQLTADGDSYSFRYAVVGRSSEQGAQDLRVDLLPDEGAYTLGLLTVRGGEALMINSQERRFAGGCDPDRLFEQFFGLQGITPDLVKALLVGRIPRLACGDLQVYRQEIGRLQLLDTRTDRVWDLDESSGELRGVELLNSAHSKVYARAGREQTPQGNRVTIEIFNPIEVSAAMQIKKFTVNPPLSEGLFDVAVPAGYARQECP